MEWSRPARVVRRTCRRAAKSSEGIGGRWGSKPGAPRARRFARWELVDVLDRTPGLPLAPAILVLVRRVAYDHRAVHDASLRDARL